MNEMKRQLSRKRKQCYFCILFIVLVFGLTACAKKSAEYEYVSEEHMHEGTWLVWPHNHTAAFEYYKVPENAPSYRDSLESIWVAMTKALHTGEKVHIVAYNDEEKLHIEELLVAENVDMSQVDFFIYETNDI